MDLKKKLGDFTNFGKKQEESQLSANEEKSVIERNQKNLKI